MEETKVTQPEVTEEVTNTNPTNDDDFFDVVDKEVINELDGESNEGEETGEENQTETEETSKEEDKDDYKALLDELSKKVKYNKESVQIDSIDDVVSNYQKGLNYDKLVEKLNNLEHSKAMSYITNKATELGMSVDDYMEQVENYEKEQEKQREQERLEEMISSGVPEDVAKEVIATSQLRKELQAEKNQLEKEKKAREDKESKDKEYEDFIKEFPDVKAEDIPKDVFLNAENSSLREAYMKYQLEEQKKQIEILKKQNENKSSSVGSTTEFGRKENKATDPFLEGWDE
jgi:hypothetical protein